MEGIVSPESSPELSPADFRIDLEAGQRQHHPPLSVQTQQPVAQALRRQESSELDPFLPDLDAEPEEPGHEPAGVTHVRGYDVNNPNPALAGQHSDDEEDEDEEGMTTSALLPGSDIF